MITNNPAWLDLGCDGFRVDMAHSLLRADPTGEHLGRLWQGFRAWLDEDYPEAVLLAEWSDPKKAIPAGFHVDFFLGFNACTLHHLTGVHYILGRAVLFEVGFQEEVDVALTGAFEIDVGPAGRAGQFCHHRTSPLGLHPKILIM